MSKQMTLDFYLKPNMDQIANSSSEDEMSEEESDYDDKEEIKQDKKTQFLFLRLAEYLSNDALKNLTEDPHDLLSTYNNLTEAGKKIVCRLFWSYSCWTHTEELQQIIGENVEYNLSVFLKSLVDNQWITEFTTGGKHNLDFDEYVKLLKTKELLEICRQLKLKAEKREDAVNALKKYSQQKPINHYFNREVSNNSSRLLNIFRSKVGVCYQLSNVAHKKFTAFKFPEHLGKEYREYGLQEFYSKVIYKKDSPVDENMSVDNASAVFQNRQEFKRYLEAQEIYKKYIEDDTQKVAIVPIVFGRYIKRLQDMTSCNSLPPWLRPFSSVYINLGILEQAIEWLKTDRPKIAVGILNMLIRQTVYKQDKKAEWYAEKALLLHEKLGKPEKAARTLREGFEANLSDETRDVMRTRAKFLINQRNIMIDDELRQILRSYSEDHIRERNILHNDYIYKTPVTDETSARRGRVLFTAQTAEGQKKLIVEKYCIHYYLDLTENKEFTNGEHWEGKMMTTIFMLLFWDIIYTKPEGVPGIYLSRHQRYPLDLYTENFYINRRTAIDNRLQLIGESTDAMVIEMLKQRWDENSKYSMWKSMEKDEMVMVARCLHTRSLAVICRRLATNSATGFPDLTLWNENTEQIKFVEVKSVRDTLSIKQLQWLHYLRNNGIAVGVAWMRNEEPLNLPFDHA